MKNALALIFCVATAAPSAAAWAQADPGSRYAQWEHRLRERVNAELAYPVGASGASGDVFVAFRVGPNGKPVDVSVQHSSGNAIFDRNAVDLISHLGRIGAIPSAAGIMSEVVLKLSYGDGADTVSQAIQVAKSDRREQLANERRNQALVAAQMRVADNH
jgi:TonB family protein